MKFVVKQPAWHSKVETPAYKGLLGKDLDFEEEVFRINSELLGLHITLIYVLREITGNKEFEVCRTRVDFNITKEEIVTPDDVYPMFVTALNTHRSFLQQVKNIESHLLEVPHFSKAELMSDLIQVSDNLNRI
jgi:hypothetical protein